MLNKTWLFVPAREKYLFENTELYADVIIYDLEDSIRPEDKDAALDRLAQKLAVPSEKEIFVRINSGKRGLAELERLQTAYYDGIMIPKVEDKKSVYAYKKLLDGIRVIALIESVAGVMKIEEIASLPELEGIAFGGEDFCRDLGVETNKAAMQYARGKTVLYAKFFGKTCFDTISLEYKDTERFIQEYQNSISMGFDSKLLIHPLQAKRVLEFADSLENISLMKEIVRSYESSTSGLVFVCGKWYEKPHIERMKRLIQQAEEIKRER